MEITWLGRGCFRLKHRDVTLILDPLGGKGAPRSLGAADVVTISHEHAEHNNRAAVGGSPRVIAGPGDYEVAAVLIAGVQTYHDARKGADRGRNTAYIIEIDDVKVCHLGDLGHVPTVAQIDRLNECDVLLVPIGGGSTIDAAGAVEVVSMLEPRIVVPMHYRSGTDDPALDPLDRFLKQMGVKEPAPVPRLSVTRNSLPIETTVTVLERRT